MFKIKFVIILSSTVFIISRSEKWKMRAIIDLMIYLPGNEASWAKVNKNNSRSRLSKDILGDPRYIVVARGSPNVYSFPRQHYYICRWVSLVCEDGEIQEYIKHIARSNVIRQFTIAKIGLKVMKKNISRIKVKGFIVPSVCSSSMS